MERMKKYTIFLIGVCGGALYWIIDVLVDVYYFNERSFVEQLFHPSLQEAWIRIFASCMIIGSGYVVARSQTEKKQTEEELDAAHMRIRDERVWSKGILDAVADGISIQGPDYRILYQNKAHRDFLGGHIGKLCYEAYEQRPSVCEHCPVALTFADGKVHTEERAAELGGEERHFEITSSPLFDASGKVVAGIESVREITRRVNADKLVRESEQRFRTLFEESKDVFYISTAEGRFLEINPAGVELFGYPSKEELLQVNIGKEIYANPLDRMRFAGLVNTTGYVKDYEVQMRRRTGEKLWVIITSTALRDPQGNVTGYRGVIRDVTEHKKLEQQLLQSQKMDAVGRLAGGIAHDFNNILTAIIGYGTLIRKQLLDNDRLRGFTDQVLESANRASRLTKSILAFSRKQLLKPAPVDLNAVISRVEKLLARLIGEDIVLKAVLHNTDLTVMADSLQLEQVLINLATNARDAMLNGGSLTIETSTEDLDEEHARAYNLSAPGTYAVVTVSDTGTGFDETTQARIFEPFFTTKEPGKGTGLGLSIVHGIVTQHGGHIMADSEPGAGTKFKIYLPRVPQGPGQEQAVPVETTPVGTETILLAEDDANVRGLVRKMLEQAGYVVFEAIDGETAVRVYREHSERIRLLLFDVVMPGKNGKEAYDEIKRSTPDIKALFISGYPVEVIHRKGILPETLDIVLKPFSEHELLHKIRTILDQ